MGRCLQEGVLHECHNVRRMLQVLHVGRQLEVTRALHNVLERSFPEEYEARRRETLEALEPPRDHTASFPVPLFVMQCIMPGAHLGSRLVLIHCSP